MMDLRQIFGIKDSYVDWRFASFLGIGLITPSFFMIIFTLVVGRLIIGENSGIFSNDFIHIYLMDIAQYILLILSLFFLLYQKWVPVLISIILASILSRIIDLFIHIPIEHFALYIGTNMVLILLFRFFINRSRNIIVGLIISFFIVTITLKIIENIFYGIHVYNHFGIQAMRNNIENGEALKKLLVDVSGGLLRTILFAAGILISYRIIKPENIRTIANN